jgi:hypothetical protein
MPLSQVASSFFFSNHLTISIPSQPLGHLHMLSTGVILKIERQSANHLRLRPGPLNTISSHDGDLTQQQARQPETGEAVVPPCPVTSILLFLHGEHRCYSSFCSHKQTTKRKSKAFISRMGSSEITDYPIYDSDVFSSRRQKSYNGEMTHVCIPSCIESRFCLHGVPCHRNTAWKSMLTRAEVVDQWKHEPIAPLPKSKVTHHD